MHSNINRLLHIIIAQYFTKNDCFLQIYDKDLHIPTVNHETITYESNNFLRIDYREKCSCFLISSTNPKKLLDDLESNLKFKSKHRYEKRKYIIVAYGNFLEVFNSTSLNFLSDFLVIKLPEKVDACRPFELFTHYYVGLEDSNSPLLLDFWFPCNSTFKYYNNLFPDKISNGKGRQLVASGCNYIPYASFVDHSGLELIMIKEYALVHNMNLVFKIFESWGAIFENWTGGGVIGSLVMDEADIGFSALFATTYRIDYSDFTIGTVFSRVSCIVPGPKVIFDWLSYFKVFGVTLWLPIIGLHIFGGLVIFFKSKGNSKTKKQFGILIQFGILLGISSPRFSYIDNLLIKIINAFLFIVSLYFVTLYNSRLLSIVVAPVYTPYIKTTKQLVESNMFWGELEIDWVIPLLTDDSKLHIALHKKFRIESFENLKKHSLKGDFAFGIERLKSGFYAIGDYFDESVVENYKVMKEDLYAQYVAFQLRKSSILLPSLNAFVLRVTQAGLFNYWESQCMLMNSNSKVQRSLQDDNDDDLQHININLEHLSGVFGLWAICLFIATLQFFKEIILGRHF